MKAVRSSEISEHIYQITRHHTAEHNSLLTSVASLFSSSYLRRSASFLRIFFASISRMNLLLRSAGGFNTYLGTSSASVSFFT